MHGNSGVARTGLLLGGVSIALLLVGAALGPVGLVLGIGAAGAVQAYGWFGSDTATLRTMRAYPVSEARQPALYRCVRELSTRLRQPMPQLFVSPTAAPNAFSVGRSRRRAGICCTEGLLAELDEPELRAVLAHELTRVHRGDVLPATAATALATAVMAPAQATWLRSGSAEDDRRGPLSALLLALLSPLAAGLLRLATPRSQAQQTDAAAATLAGDPLTLARALRSLDAAVRRAPLRAEPELRAVGALMIVDPFRPDRVGRRFSTRPSTADRIAHLETLAGYRR